MSMIASLIAPVTSLTGQMDTRCRRQTTDCA
jgi:hypothetical protein